MNTYNYQNLVTSGTVMNTTINGPPMQLENMVTGAMQIVFTGTPTGSFKLQSSCDPVPKQTLNIGVNGVPLYTVTNWTDVANSSFSVSAAGNVFWNLQGNLGYTYVRFVYTDSSSGSSTAIITVSSFVGKGP